MRFSRLFGRTLREAPGGSEAAGEQLLIRAGLVRGVANGIFAVLPLGQRAIARIEAGLCETLAGLGGQELALPTMYAAETHESGALRRPRPAATPVMDSQGRQYVLGREAAAVIVELAANDIRSYRQLPVLVYGRRRVWQDDGEKGGLLEARETPALESYGLATDAAGGDAQIDALRETYDALFRACGVPIIWVAGAAGEHIAVHLTPQAHRTVLQCDACGYAATAEYAAFARTRAAPEALLPIEKVATPDAKTIADLAHFLGIPENKTAKAIFLMATRGGRESFVFAVVRGDLDLSEAKLAQALGASRLRPAVEDEIRATGATPGYASPIGLRNVMVVVDESIPGSANLVAGANETGYHLLNTNLDRDYTATLVADIAAARAGDGCPHCSAPLRAATGAAVAHLALLTPPDAVGNRPTYLDPQGRSAPIVLTAGRIDWLPLLACIAETHHDDHGLLLPRAVAPYDVHLVLLGGGETEAEGLYAALQEAGLAVLYDDRGDSPGVKFNDADLIGLPVRLTVGKRSLQQGGVELKLRTADGKDIVPLAEVVARIRAELDTAPAALDAKH